MLDGVQVALVDHFSRTSARDVLHLDPEPRVYIPGRYEGSIELTLIPPRGLEPRVPAALYSLAASYDPVSWLLRALKARLNPFPPFEKIDATTLSWCT